MRALVASSVLLTAVGLGLWWAAPNMAAPLFGLMLAAAGVVLTATGAVVGSRGNSRGSDGAGPQ